MILQQISQIHQQDIIHHALRIVHLYSKLTIHPSLLPRIASLPFPPKSSLSLLFAWRISEISFQRNRPANIINHNLNRMNHGPLIIMLLLLQLTRAQILDTSSKEQHGVSFASQPCSANTVIDFSFSSNSVLTLAGTVSNPSASTLRYLDVIGNQKVFTLVQGQLDTSNTFLTGFSKSFVFQYTSGSSTVFVAIPIIDNGATPTAEAQQTVSLSTVKDPPLQSLASYNSGATTITLSTFNFLNDITYGKFYETMDKNTMTTLLVNKIHYKFTGTLTGVAGSLLVPASYAFTSSTTGDVLCWGSQYYTGFFQTHMRESVPLWTFLLFTFFFWLFNLLSAEVTPEVYERSFKDNKWTCWSLYSLYWLCHQQWFTRTARSSLLLMNFFWQCMVLAAIYNYQGVAANSSIIIWAAVVAYAVSIPIPYLVGNVFFQRIYTIQIDKFQTLHELHKEIKKEKHEQLQRSAILKEEHIYGIFYFYYSACILLFIVFGILSVHLMQQFPRDFYHLHWYWLASAGIAFALDHLIVDPIMTLLFGDRQFYRSRGYYYNADLGELARLVD